MLIPEQKKPTFAEFSAGWWDIETCRYLKWHELHEPITDSTLIIYQANFKNQIKDYFAKYKLSEVTPLVIENWLLFMRDKSIMRNESKRKKMTIMPKRIGKFRGLRSDMVFDDYIHIQGQYLRKKYVDHTKTKENRTIPIYAVMRKILDDLLAKNGNGYVFSDDGGKTPISNNLLNIELNRTLMKIGISYEEKLKRNLSFHAWRHFLNTLLLTSDISFKKVQIITEHKSLKMTDRFTHFDTKHFTGVVYVKNNLLAEVIETGQKTSA